MFQFQSQRTRCCLLQREQGSDLQPLHRPRQRAWHRGVGSLWRYGLNPPPPPPPSRTDWTRLVHPLVLTGHISSLPSY